jgi:hypothetical protein
MQIEIELFHHWGECLCENYYAMNRAEVEEGRPGKKMKMKKLRILTADLRG